MLRNIGVFIKNLAQCTGGRGVIEGLGSQLKLNEHQRQPSAQTLYHYGAPEGP
jgi:hypothetical protein